MNDTEQNGNKEGVLWSTLSGAVIYREIGGNDIDFLNFEKSVNYGTLFRLMHLKVNSYMLWGSHLFDIHVYIFLYPRGEH